MRQVPTRPTPDWTSHSGARPVEYVMNTTWQYVDVDLICYHRQCQILTEEHFVGLSFYKNTNVFQMYISKHNLFLMEMDQTVQNNFFIGARKKNILFN